MNFLCPDVIDGIPANVAIIDNAGVIVKVNAGWTDFAVENGLHDEIFCLGSNMLDTSTNASGDELLISMGVRSVLAGDSDKFSHEYTAPGHGENGSHLQVTPVVSTEGRSAVAVHWSVTPDEVALRLQYELAAIVESSTNAIIGKDLHGNIKIWNTAAEQLFGYSASEAIGQSIMLLVPADRADEERTIMSAVAGGEIVPHMDTVRIRKDGSHVNVAITVSPMRDADGVVVGSSKIVRDTTIERRTLHALEASEYRYRQIVETSSDGIWTVDRAGDTNFSNARLRSMLGYSESELIGQRLTDFVVGNAAPWDVNIETRAPGIAQHFETGLRRKNGETLDAILTVTPFVDEAGGALVMANDISARKAAEAEVLNTARQLAAVVSALRELGTFTGSKAALLDFAAEKCLSVCSAEGAAIGIMLGDEIECQGASGIADGVRGTRMLTDTSHSGTIIASGEAFITGNAEMEPNVDQDTVRFLGARSIIATPLHTVDKSIGLIAAYSTRLDAFTPRDVANLQLMAESLGALWQRCVAEEELRASEEDYRILFQGNRKPMWVHDVSTLRFLAVNAAALELYGWSESEFLKMQTSDLLPATRGGNGAPGVSEDPITPGVLRHRTREGRLIFVEESADDIAFAAIAARLVQAEDVTLRITTDAHVVEQASLLDRARDAIVVLDLDHVVHYWNIGAERIYGWTREEAIGISVAALLYDKPDKFHEAMKVALKTGEWTGDLSQIDRAKNRLTVETRWTLLPAEGGNPPRILSIGTDITERKKIEMQFLRAQRMESIGTLAGGIAHDLNNVLAPIMLSVDLLRDDINSEDGLRVLDTLASSAQRGADMVRQVLSFARGVEGEKHSVDIRALMRDVTKISQDTFPKSITVSASIPEELPPVIGDATQIHQVLLNLCVNARDAMGTGGTLTISATSLEVDAHYAAMNIDAREGHYVIIRVQDTGTGISPAVLERMFDPFFTTKAIGGGTGLGLSTSLAIIKSHGGFIHAYSEIGEGSSFRVYLPAATAADGADKPDVTAAPLPRGNGELVLVVDDEAAIRMVTQRTLETFGYRVLLAFDGAEAVAVFAQQAGNIDVVLTDMMMPVMDGRATIAAMLHLKPLVKIIAASGGAADLKLVGGPLSAVKHFLAKPYTAETLLHAVQATLHP